MIFKGSPKYKSYLDISKTFDANGISFNAFTSKNITAYHFKFLSTKENLKIICDITSDMILHPLMNEKDIKTERNVIIQEFNDDADDIDEYIADKLESTLLEGHPLSYTIIGTLKTLHSIKREQLLEYHKKYYRLDNLLIGFSGKMRNEYFDIITSYFGGAKTFEESDINMRLPTLIIPYVNKNIGITIDCFPKKLSQDYINIVFKTNGYFDPMNNHYRMLANILGSNMSSRLFIEIREKLGLVYYI
jgi:predicted Zn-dependent peptidase